MHFFVIDRAANLPPVADDQSVTVDEDSSGMITLTGSDPNGDALTFTVITAPEHGVLTGFDPSTRQVTYTPFANYRGPDSFQFRVDDRKLGIAEGTISITVAAVNDRPTGTAQSVTVTENGSRLIVLGGSDLETPATSLAFAIASGPAHGSLSQEAYNSFRYTPEADYFGPDEFTFAVTDRGDPDDSGAGNELASVPVAVSITVLEGNEAPVINTIAPQDVNEGGSLLLVVTASDPDTGDVLTFSLIAGPIGSSITPAGQFSWLPPDGPRTVTVTVRVTDDGTPSESDTETFTITVHNVAPTLAVTSGASVVEDDLYTLTLSVSDPGTDTVSSWTVDWGDGAVNTQMTHVYANPGAYTINATANDEDGAYAAAPFDLTVLERNLPPVAGDDEGAGFATDQDAAFTTGDVLANDSDPNTADHFSVTGVNTAATHGLVTDNGDGTFTYDPNGWFDYLALGESAVDTFTYTIGDSQGLTDTATVTIAVTGRNDAPAATDDLAAGHRRSESL